MLFNSLEYLIFLPLVALLYFVTAQRYRWIVLLLASYAFYMSWRVDFALLIFASTLVDYWAGRQMGKAPDRAGKKKYLIASLVVNLGMLFRVT